MVCNKEYIWTPSNCACECDNSCGIGHLDYRSCVCRNSLVDKLVEECTDVIDGDTIYNKTLTVKSSNDCTSCTPYIVLFAVFLLTSVITSCAFVYYWYFKKSTQLNSGKKAAHVKFNPHTQTTIY